MQVPYISQWDPTAVLSRGDCGVVAACMVALWKGIETTPDAMLKRAGLPVGRMTYSFSEIIIAARHVGLELEYRSGATWEVIRNELILGQPVIPLLRYNEISGNQDDFAGAHFWLCVGFDATHVICHDSNWRQPRRDEGAYRRVPLDELRKAIGEALLPTGNGAHQALFVKA